MSDAGTVAFYDRAAAAKDFSADGPPEPALARFIDHLPQGAAVLDFGCGHGIASAHLARAGHIVTGLDASAGLLEVARRLAPEATFILGGFDELDAVSAYDGVWANFALLHAPRAEMGSHLARIVRRCGRAGCFTCRCSSARMNGAMPSGAPTAISPSASWTGCWPRRALSNAAATPATRPGHGGAVDPFVAYLMEKPA